MLFSKRKLKVIRLWLLTPKMEFLLLITYIILFPIAIYVTNYQIAYDLPQDQSLNNYDSREQVRKYFLP